MRRAAAAFLIVALGAALGCGRKKSAVEGHGQAETSAAAAVVPTPDTTPIEALRTPAGLVLKTSGQTPVAVTPSPSAGATPAPGKAGS